MKFSRDDIDFRKTFSPKSRFQKSSQNSENLEIFREEFKVNLLAQKSATTKRKG